jgi:hypothetical protein
MSLPSVNRLNETRTLRLSPGFFFTLDKGYYGNGLLLGKLFKSALHKRITTVRKFQNKGNFSTKELMARVSDFSRLLAKIQPLWLEEVQGVAKGAGVDANDILLINCLPAGFYPPYGGCTSFIDIGRHENRLFKIRDERNNPQIFYTKHLPNGMTLQAGHDVGNIGHAHCFTSVPLSGANNTGSVINTPFDAPLLNDCHMIRYISEQARNVREIPGIIMKLQEQNAIKGAAYGRGYILLFMDAEQGLIIEGIYSDFTYKYFDHGIHVRANHFLLPKAQKWLNEKPNQNTRQRLQRMTTLLKKGKNRPPSINEIFAFARDRKNQPNSLCNDDKKHFWMTISAQLHVIDRLQPAKSVNYFCCGNTRHSVFIPMPLTERRSFVPLASGDYYNAATRLYRSKYKKTKLMPRLHKIENITLDMSSPMRACSTAYHAILNALRRSRTRFDT